MLTPGRAAPVARRAGITAQPSAGAGTATPVGARWHDEHMSKRRRRKSIWTILYRAHRARRTKARRATGALATRRNTIVGIINQRAALGQAAPSMRELAEVTGVSTRMISKDVDALVAAGRVHRTPGEARSLRATSA